MNHDHMNHLEHMQHMSGHGSTFPFLSLLAGFFLLGALFYCFRLFSPKYLTKVNGYLDRENEVWHGACMVGMVSCLAPTWFGIADLFWQVTFAVGTVWYLVRAFTYGRTLPFNKQWYDFAHAAMMFGMWWMFAAPLSGIVVTVVFTAYWAWFGSYYAMRLYNDFKKPHWLSFGQDIAHFGMAVVMALMMVFPTTFMGHQHNMPSHDMPGHSAPGHDMPGHDMPGHDMSGHDMTDPSICRSPVTPADSAASSPKSESVPK